MEHERIMLTLAAQGRIFLKGAGYEAPPMPAPIMAAAVQTGGGIKAKRDANLRRSRMALAGQGSMMAGGSMAGGSTGGKTLMGA